MRKLLAAIILACLTIAPAWAQGGPYASTVMGQIRRLPNGGRPQTKVVFPEIRKDWKTLKISLERSACFGDCPDYKVQISADGTVDYEGHRSVVISGKHHARIDPQMVRKLFNAFEKADFFWLFDDYAAPVTDLPSYKLQLSFGGRTKSVGDYAGPAIGMPKAVRELEEQVDAVAQTDRWVSGTAQTFAYLKSQRWNFRSPSRKNVALFNFAMESKDDAFFCNFWRPECRSEMPMAAEHSKALCRTGNWPGYKRFLWPARP